MALKTLNVTIKGTSVLMTHNGQLIDPVNPIVKSIKEISSKRKKAEEDHLLMSQLEILGGIYPEYDLTREEDPGYEVGEGEVKLTGEWGHCIIPENVIEATILGGAKKHKLGPKFKAGVRVMSPSYIISNDKPLTVEEVFYNRKYKFTTNVKVGSASIMRSRPIYPNWKLNFDVLVDTEVLNVEEVKTALDTAGKMVGLAEYRPRYGSFTLLSFLICMPAFKLELDNTMSCQSN
jgi:hypothetical protein